MSKVTDPNAKGGNGFIWGVGVLLVIIAVVIGYIVWNGKQSSTCLLYTSDAADDVYQV